MYRTGRTNHIPATAVLCCVLLLSCNTGVTPEALASRLIADSAAAYPQRYTPSATHQEMLVDLLSGAWDANHQGIIWKGTAGDMHEFNAQLNPNPYLYTFVDTCFAIDRGADTLYYVVFRTAAMTTNEAGGLVPVNSCHVCGLNIGYYSYTVDQDSIYLHRFKRNLATHGSFGAPTYTLSMINLGEGYALLKVDDPYEGMGIHSVSTRFYADGELVLSMISAENNSGSREKNEQGYYEFHTGFTYGPELHAITIRQRGYRIDEQSGKKEAINKTKKLKLDQHTLQF